MIIYRDKVKLYGELYLPGGQSGRHPLVILMHGFGGNMTRMGYYAKMFNERGIAAFAFDFAGECPGRRSDPDPDGSSLLTEAADLNAVLDTMRGHEAVDPERIFLMGCSQGGVVASYVAAQRANDIRALIAFYPAYVIRDDEKRRFPDSGSIPVEYEVMGRRLGRRYHEDALSFDIYDMMPDFEKNVLIVHGSADPIVPVSYAGRAAETFPRAELVILEGAGHGFRGEYAVRAGALAADFVGRQLQDR